MDELRSKLAHGIGWATASLGCLSLNEWGIVIGIATSIGTFAINWYYKAKAARGQS